MYEITVHNQFSASHAIRLSSGSLEPVHDHNWRVAVTVGSKDLDSIDVVMDFHQLEQMVLSLTKQADHRHLNEIEPFASGEISPTAERIAWWIGTQLMKSLPRDVVLVRVCVEEAPGCEATYQP